MTTPDGRILACNPAFVAILQFPDRGDALAASMISLYPDEREHARFVALLRERKRLEHFECVRRRRDGVLIHVVENAVGHFDERGNLQQIRGYLFDNTARIQAEEALLQKDREISGQLKKIEKLNAALTTLLEHREQESRQKMESVRTTLEKLVMPYLGNLKTTRLDKVSSSAVAFHRNNIRAKLGLTRKPTNLVSYLRVMGQQ